MQVDLNLGYFLHYDLIEKLVLKGDFLFDLGKVTSAYQLISFSMKQLGIFLLPPGWDVSPSEGYPPALNLPLPINLYPWVERAL